ncbi:hypothetical protein [Ekhidna sp.]|uniref:hypothetical protein n=1 Tax=Ekhidna sp. TaxID=2608089 RepID=UPI003B510DE0
MACKSGNINEAAQKSGKARDALEKLEEEMKAISGSYKREFSDQIDETAKSLDIDDFKKEVLSYDMKVEYSSEFSLEAMVEVIVKTLNVVGKSIQGGSLLTVLTSNDYVESYKGFVNAIAEAAKSSSSISFSSTFSMTKIAKGTYAFLSSASRNITDKDTFGKEAVTATTIFYAVYHSQKKFDSDTEYSMYYTHALNYDIWQEILTERIKQFKDGQISMQDYISQKSFIQQQLEELKEKIEKERTRLGIAKNASSSIRSFAPMKAIKSELHFHKSAFVRSDRELAKKLDEFITELKVHNPDDIEVIKDAQWLKSEIRN